MYTTGSTGSPLFPLQMDFNFLMASNALLTKTKITDKPARMCTIQPLLWLKLTHLPLTVFLISHSLVKTKVVFP